MSWAQLIAMITGGFAAACFGADLVHGTTTPRTLLGLMCCSVVGILVIWF